MTEEELEIELKRNKEVYEKEKLTLLKAFAIQNNPFNIGDKISDTNDTIIIDKIQFAYNFDNTRLMCRYLGFRLKKDGTPFKNGQIAAIYQSNAKLVTD